MLIRTIGLVLCADNVLSDLLVAMHVFWHQSVLREHRLKAQLWHPITNISNERHS